jgi:hypothetical protein
MTTKLGALPPNFKRIRVGPLSFDVIRSHGILIEIRVSSFGSRQPLVLEFGEPRLQPISDVLIKIIQDLYVTAKDPDKIRDLSRGMGLTPDQDQILEAMIDWSARHYDQVMQTARAIMPGLPAE